MFVHLEANMQTNSATDQWDYTLLNISSKLADPICKIYSLLRYRLVAPLDPKKFNHYPSLVQEVAFRVLIGTSALLLCASFPMPVLYSAATLGVGSKVLRAIGFVLQKDNYTHVYGQAPEKTLSGQIKIMSWNVCGPAGGFTYDHGGVVDWQARFDRLAGQMMSENPDVIILQEIYDGSLADALIKKLETHYAHFFCRLGKSTMGSEGGLMVISKCAVHRFKNTDFSTNDWTLKRGFATLELKTAPDAQDPSIRIIGTHLIHGDSQEDKDGRAIQIKEIAQETDSSLPTILAGDFNIERDAEEGKLLSAHVNHAYLGSEPTCTNELVEQWDLAGKSVWNETIDNISLFKQSKQLEVVDCHLSKAFDKTFNTRTALSDHHGVVATFNLI